MAMALPVYLPKKDLKDEYLALGKVQNDRELTGDEVKRLNELTLIVDEMKAKGEYDRIDELAKNEAFQRIAYEGARQSSQTESSTPSPRGVEASQPVAAQSVSPEGAVKVTSFQVPVNEGPVKFKEGGLLARIGAKLGLGNSVPSRELKPMPISGGSGVDSKGPEGSGSLG